MIDKYNLLFKEFKEYIDKNSQYNVRVVKHNTNTSTHFPVISFVLTNFINTNDCTIDKIEYYDNFYFTIDIYSKNKIISGKTISSQVISEDLLKLVLKFFDKKNMLRTSCKPTFNLDDSISRINVQYQCAIGNARGNIIRR
jgi:hypothetical protein